MELPPIESAKVYRVLDANLNRASEALRVVEEVARFDLSDSHLSRQLKQLRHQINQLFLDWHPKFLSARDTPSDVGTSISTATEQARANIKAITAANFARLSQALRSLEEFSKLIEPELGPQIERIRYRSYSLEKAIAHGWHAAGVFDGKALYAINDGDTDLNQFSRRVAQLMEIGVDVIQLRDKQLDDRELLLRSRALADATRGKAVRSIINDRADIALAASADGVHLGQEDLPVAAVRQIAGDRLLIGVSTHSIEQARAAELDGADYIGVGPTFPSKTKPFAEFPGTQLLQEVAAEIAIPAFAIGGITRHNVAQVLATGVRRVAVQAALQDGNSAAENAAAMKAELLGPLAPSDHRTAPSFP